MTNSQKLIQAFNTSIDELTPVQWAELNRYLTSDVTPWEGYLDYSRTPYLKEIVNSIMANVNAKVITVMKGSQIGITIAGILTMMGWVIKQSPSNILFIAKDDAAIKRMMQGSIDQMINNSGLSHLIGNSNIRGNRKSSTGDTMTGKKFNGGNLYTWSGQSIGSLSEISVKYGFYDEVERYKGVDKQGGDFFSLINARHKAYKDVMKSYYMSTPEIKQTSNIEPLFLKGDQREYHIPCKHCGELITIGWNLKVDDLDGRAGVVFKRDNLGKLIKDSVQYRCQLCGEHFKETHKYDMLEQDLGIWIPKADPISEIYRSYKLPSLIAPAGMFGWADYAQDWCEIHPKGKPINTSKLQTFVNQCLAETYELTGRSIVVTQLGKNTRNYEINTVPNALSVEDGNGKIILITCAVDLNGFEDDARLDYEVVAWSVSGSSYSLDHGSIGTFERSKAMRYSKRAEKEQAESERIKWTYKTNQPNNVWDEFKKTIMSRTYAKDDSDKRMPCAIFGIDTGFFNVYSMAFVNANQKCVALKGKVDSKFTKYDVDKAYYKKSTKVDKLYLVEGDNVKNDLANFIELEWDEKLNLNQPEGFMNFPRPTDDKYQYKSYFHEYEGEKRELELNHNATAVGFRWVKKHSSSVNHFFDCRVYAHVCKNIITEQLCKAAKRPVSWDQFGKLLTNTL